MSEMLLLNYSASINESMNFKDVAGIKGDNSNE